VALADICQGSCHTQTMEKQATIKRQVSTLRGETELVGKECYMWGGLFIRPCSTNATGNDKEWRRDSGGSIAE